MSDASSCQSNSAMFSSWYVESLAFGMMDSPFCTRKRRPIWADDLLCFFAASALHYLFILKPFDNFDPLGLYVSAFCLAGVVAYVYTLLPVGSLRGWRRYTLSAVEETGDALAVTMVPMGRGHRHYAGQFAFLRLDVPGHQEIHPFTVSKAPDEGRELRFTIKGLGDYTNAIRGRLSGGNVAQVSRPFGHFRPLKGGHEEIWIASGVGITPFLAWTQALSETDGPRHLFYCVRDRESAPHLAELEALATHKANLTLHVVQSRSEGRLQPEDVASAVRGDKRKAVVAFCGPKEMREVFRQGLAGLGFSPARFRYEEFEIRSGLGLRRLIGWLFSRFGAAKGK